MLILDDKVERCSLNGSTFFRCPECGFEWSDATCMICPECDNVQRCQELRDKAIEILDVLRDRVKDQTLMDLIDSYALQVARHQIIYRQLCSDLREECSYTLDIDTEHGGEAWL